MAATLIADLRLNQPNYRRERPFVQVPPDYCGSLSEPVEGSTKLEEHRALVCYWYLNSM